MQNTASSFRTVQYNNCNGNVQYIDVPGSTTQNICACTNSIAQAPDVNVSYVGLCNVAPTPPPVAPPTPTPACNQWTVSNPGPGVVSYQYTDCTSGTLQNGAVTTPGLRCVDSRTQPVITSGGGSVVVGCGNVPTPPPVAPPTAPPVVQPPTAQPCWSYEVVNNTFNQLDYSYLECVTGFVGSASLGPNSNSGTFCCQFDSVQITSGSGIINNLGPCGSAPTAPTPPPTAPPTAPPTPPPTAIQCFSYQVVNGDFSIVDFTYTDCASGFTVSDSIGGIGTSNTFCAQANSVVIVSGNGTINNFGSC